MLKIVETNRPCSLSGGIQRHAQMLGNVGFETAFAAPRRLKKLEIERSFPAPGYSAISTPKKGRSAVICTLTIPDIQPAPQGQTEQSEHPKRGTDTSSWMLSFADMAPALQEQSRQPGHPKKGGGSSSWMMTIDDIRAVPLEQTKQQGHPKRGAGQGSALLVKLAIAPMRPGQNVQPVHPKKRAAGKQLAQSAHLKKPETDRTRCRQFGQFGHSKKGVSRFEVGQLRHPKKGDAGSSGSAPLWLLARSSRTKLTPEKARGLSLAARQTAQTSHAKRCLAKFAVQGAAAWCAL